MGPGPGDSGRLPFPLLQQPQKDSAVLTFFQKREHEVQSFMLKLVNNNCPELKALEEGPRLETRVNMTLVVLVIPIVRKRPKIEQMFAAVTKEFTTLGLSLVLNEPRAVDEVVVGFRWEGEMKFIRATAKHLSPMGAGFYQVGLQLNQMLHPSDWPELEGITL